ncbi:MAG: hypothetical protein LBC39_08695 [Methanobrevibacter sp.]|nr:hypothetical protein [Candidatus Methanovirga aequatorialis]
MGVFEKKEEEFQINILQKIRDFEDNQKEFKEELKNNDLYHLNQRLDKLNDKIDTKLDKLSDKVELILLFS